MKEKGKAINRKVKVEERKLNEKNFCSTNYTETKGIVSRIKGLFFPKTPQSGLWGVVRCFALICVFALWGIVAFASDYRLSVKVPINPDKRMEIVIQSNPIDESSYNEAVITVMDKQGNPVASKVFGFTSYCYSSFLLRDFFPDLDFNNVSSVFITGTYNPIYVYLREYTVNGDDEPSGMNMVPTKPSWQAIIPHITTNPYWQTSISVLNLEQSNVYLSVYPDNETYLLDGSYSETLGQTLPDLANKISAVFDPGQLLRNYQTDDKYIVLKSQIPASDPFSSPENSQSLIVLGNFFTENSGGSLSASIESNILYFKHIDVGYWWTGIALANNNDGEANIRILYFDNNGWFQTSYNASIPARGKLVDLVENLGAPLINGEYNGYAVILADKPIVGLELFGDKNHQTTASVKPGVGISGTYYWRTDFDPGRQGVILPYAHSNENDWSGIAFINDNTDGALYTVDAISNIGGFVDRTGISLAPGQKKTVLVKDLFKDLSEEELAKISSIIIYGSDRDDIGLNGYERNFYPNVFMLTGDLNHTRYLVGIDPILLLSSRAPVIKLLGLVNETVSNKLDGLEQLITDNTITVEHNDTVKVGFYGLLPDPRVNVDDGTTLASLDMLSLLLYNEDGEMVYAFCKAFDTRDYEQKGYTEGFINPIDLSPGTYKLVLRIDCILDGNGTIALYDTGRYMKITEEKDYDIDALKGEGYSYDTAKSNLEKLAELLSLEEILYMDGNHYDYEHIKKPLSELFDGDLSNLEARKILIHDTWGSPAYGDAGALLIQRTDGNYDTFFTSSEHTVYLWREFFGLND